MTATVSRKVIGSPVKPSSFASGVYGSKAPTTTTVKVEATRARPGLLRKKGLRRVRMTKMTRVWVASDSTNQPDRNRVAPAEKTHSMTAKVRKSNRELIGPKKSMK